MVASRLQNNGGRTAVALCAVALSCGRAGAAGPALPDEVRAALRENGERLSPITITWTRQNKSPIGPEQTLKRLRWDDHVERFFYKSKQRISWQDGKIYIYRERPDWGGRDVIIHQHEDSFDGKVLYGGTHNPTQAVLFKRFAGNVGKEEPTAAYLDAGYFKEVGFHFPEMGQWEKPRAESDLLYRLDHGGVLESVEKARLSGRDVLRVAVIAPNPVRQFAEQLDLKQEEESLKGSKEASGRQRELLDGLRRQRRLPDKRRFVYYLDPAFRYAVRRSEQWYEPDTLLRRCDCSEFEPLSGRPVWLPKRCEDHYYEYFTIPGQYFKQPILTEAFEVTAMDTVALPANRFVLKYEEPGTYVRDATLPEAATNGEGFVSYTVPAQPGDLDNVIDRARKGEKFTPLALPTRRNWRATRTLIAANMLLFMAVVGYLLWRRGGNVPAKGV